MPKESMLPVNRASAKLFLNQCIGGYSGHMSEIAFSPTIRAIADAHGVNSCAWCSEETQADFAQLLRMMADELTPETSPPHSSLVADRLGEDLRGYPSGRR